MRAIDLGSWSVFQTEEKKWNTFLETQPLQAQMLVNCEDSTGVQMRNCAACERCFALSNADHCFESGGNLHTENSDSLGEDAQYATQALGLLSSQRVAYSVWVEHCYDIFYSKYALQSHDCFGCFGVRKSAYCIMNQRYSQSEYEELRKKIIGHMNETGEWGKFFPARFAPSVHEKSIAKILISREFDNNPEVIQRFGLRSESTKETGSGLRGRSVSELPDSCDDTDDALTTSPFLCDETGRPYNITGQEIKFYKKQRIPLPRVSWRTAIEHEYPFFYPTPHQTLCGECGVTMYSYIRPDKTTRRILCDACFTAST